MSYVRPSSSAASASWYGATGYERPSSASAGARWEPDLPAGRISAPSPLAAGAASLFAGVAVPVEATAAAPSPLAGMAIGANHDFTGLLGDVDVEYVMDLVTPLGAVRVPISSWQATLQTGRKSYAQCVVPACGAWVAELSTATAFVISRRANLPGGGAIEYEMARAPVQALQYDRGSQRYTATVSGYGNAFAASENPPAIYDRELQQRRSVSSGGSSMRVRCAVDWLLRPGHRALVDGVPFRVGYINYYVNGTDAFSDVGGEA